MKLTQLQVELPRVTSMHAEPASALCRHSTDRAAAERRSMEVASALKRLVVRRCLHQISAAEFESRRAEIMSPSFNNGEFKEYCSNSGSQA